MKFYVRGASYKELKADVKEESVGHWVDTKVDDKGKRG